VCSHGTPESEVCIGCADEAPYEQEDDELCHNCGKLKSSAMPELECVCGVEHPATPKPHVYDFDGPGYEPALDRHRLNSQLRKLWVFMLDGKWHTNTEMLHAVGGSGTGTTARYRDFRKARFGGHTVERRRVEGGLFEYRLIPNGELR
jgi:hypothetical protein